MHDTSNIKFGLLVSVISYSFQKLNRGHMDRWAGKHTLMIKFLSNPK